MAVTENGFTRNRLPTCAFQPATSRVRHARARPTETAASAKWAGCRRTAPAWVRPLLPHPPPPPHPHGVRAAPSRAVSLQHPCLHSAPRRAHGEGDWFRLGLMGPMQRPRCARVWPTVSGRVPRGPARPPQPARGAGKVAPHQLSLPVAAQGGSGGSDPGFIRGRWGAGSWAGADQGSGWP